MTLQIGVLGPFRISADGEHVDVPPGRLQALLATLALSAGRPVSVDRLAAAVWGDDFSVDVRVNLQSNVRRLRRLLGDDVISTASGGYALEVGPDDVDALWFLRKLDEAAVATDHKSQRDALADALILWRGLPFEGIGSDWLENTQATRLEERYLAAVERRIDLDLAAAESGIVPTPSVVDIAIELGELTSRFPLRESLWVRHLVALQMCGNPAEALERYDKVRVHLRDELGTDPGPELQRVHADLLAGRTLHVPSAAAVPRMVPRQLPADTAVFAGRHAALRTLATLKGDEDEQGDQPTTLPPTPGPPTVATITGTAGVGKTTLAVYWAHRVADRFPDGQLYVNLRGFDPTGSPVQPADALRGFLDALQVSPQQIPTGLDAQAGLFRSVMAGRRMLLVLDNARNADQVAPLLPGAAGCLVIVTSRDQLPGLVAGGARPVPLDLLDREDSEGLLVRRIGQERVTAEPGAIGQLIDRCVGLPLALAIVAAHVASRPDFPLATLADSLQDATHELDMLDAGDTSTSARAVFSWSYRDLTEPAARIFRLLGLHPGPDTAMTAVACLAGSPPAQVRPLLAELTRAHLVVEHAPGRYAFHDLLRAYAVEQTRSADPEPDRNAATHRLFDYYLHSAHAADHLLYPHDEKSSPDPPRPGVTIETPVDQNQALAWFEAEHRVLLAAVREANRAGLHHHACQLAWTLSLFLHRQGRWHDRAAAHHAALGAARRLADPVTEARAHRHLAEAEADLGRYTVAHRHYGHALNITESIGDIVGQAEVHYHRNLAYGQQDRPVEALAAALEAHRLFEQAGDRVGQANALTDVGWWHGRLGDHQEAMSLLNEALTLHQQLGNLAYQAHTWSCLGETHSRAGDLIEAIASYRHAIELFGRIGDLFGEASSLAYVAALQRAVGDAGADDAGQRAQSLVDALDPPAAEQLRAQLRLLGVPSNNEMDSS